MKTPTPLPDLAVRYHDALPGRIRRYLNQERGIPDLQIDAHQLGWNGFRITIPVYNREGELAFFKLARDPEDTSDSPKMMTTRGASAELYGWDDVLKKPPQIVICEGEFDRLVLEARGFVAVTSTGGASVFRPEWAKDFELIPEVYISFDNDPAGRDGACRVGRMIPHARVIELPDEVGPSGDVTDFFVRLGRTRQDFLGLMHTALPASPLPEGSGESAIPQRSGLAPELRDRADAIKRELAIEKVVGHYLQMHRFGNALRGLCPFHQDRNPSLTVYPETGTFHCFGCRKHGDVITFVRELHDLSFRRALEELEQFTPHADEKAA